MKTNACIFRFNDEEAYANAIARLGATNHNNYGARDPEGPKLQHIGFDLQSIHWSPYIMFDLVVATRVVSKQHVEDIAKQRIATVEDQHGSITKAARKKIFTEAYLDYVPQAPLSRKRVSVFFANGHLYVQTSSAAVAEACVKWISHVLNGMLVKSMENAMADITPLSTFLRVAVHERHAGRDLELGSSGVFYNGTATLRVKDIDLSDHELHEVIAGKDVKELQLLARLDAIMGGDVAEFTLNEHWQIKGLQNLFEIEGEEWDQAVETHGDHLAGKILMASMLDDLRAILVRTMLVFHQDMQPVAEQPTEA